MKVDLVLSLRRILLLFLFFLSPMLSSTIVVISDLPTMAKKSDVIVHAKVIDKSVKEDKENRIVTTVTFKIIDGMKGAKTGDIKTIYQVGGQLRGRVVRISGAHQYHKGEEFVLFAMNWGDMLVSYGVGLGKFRVIRDKEGTRVVEDLHDLIAVKPNQNHELVFAKPTPRQYASLDEFKNAIDQALHSPRFQTIENRSFKLKQTNKKPAK